MPDVDAEAWLLIADEPEAQKLVVTWPKAYAEWRAVLDDERGDGPEVPEDDIVPSTDEAMDAMVTVWGDLSGVEEQRIRHFVPILFENQLLGWDGTQADRIVNLLRAQVAADIRRATR